jgi:hypothetical protein
MNPQIPGPGTGILTGTTDVTIGCSGDQKSRMGLAEDVIPINTRRADPRDF